ncbi:RNA polymerase sigma factor [Parapedobacter lycopersici]|uniref:RNA polymerase sigma factor n=1 Tax=Parapedobacter lycopersici TaxID=1864939 RepID=UPI00214D967A|nr:sigma-70 family RNA polymerase sigma factor [Parapedobacter lycopersici]
MRNMHELPSESAELIALASGDAAAFNAVYRRHYKAVYANIFKLVKKTEHAEDILQDVFVSLWQNRFKIRSDRPVAGWLFVVSYHKALTFLKQAVRRPEEYVDSYVRFESLLDDETHDEAVFEQRLNAIEEAVESLSARRKAVFRLCRLEGKTNEEAADMLDLSTETVKDYLKHATKAIKVYIGAKYPQHLAEIAVLFMLLSN